MAPFAAVFCSVMLNLFFLLIATETNSNYSLNSTMFPEQNDTFNSSDIYTTTQFTQFESTTLITTLSSTKPPAPVLPADPMPLSGRLPTPLTSVAVLCPCDEHKDMCDMNCCCDSECGSEVALFTGCSVHTVRGSEKLCNRDVASYSLRTTIDGYSELQSSVQNEKNYDVFCIYFQNRVEGFAHPSPALPTDRNFDSLFKQFTSFTFSSQGSSQVSTTEPQVVSGYQYGDVMELAVGGGQRGVFFLPASGVTADCVDTSPAAFLKEQSSKCSRRVNLQQDCERLPALNMDTYTNVQLFSGKTTNAALVPVEVVSVVLQSLKGTQTEVQFSDGQNLLPVLLSPGLCANIVLKVQYMVKYNPAGEIVSVTVSLVLGFVQEAPLPLGQTFQIKYFQENEPEVTVHFSGNPGYVVGLPLVSGQKTMEGLSRSSNPEDTLSLLQSSVDQDCLWGPQLRSPVLFGLDSVSGCTIRLEDTTNCSLISQVLLDVLRGPNYPQFVASFGNSPLNKPLDWVPIKREFNPQESQSCTIPLSLHLEIEWTKYGTLVNPQSQIVTVNEIIRTNTSQLALLSGGSSIISITNSVAFIPVSAPASPGYRAMPTINAKLPFDFFFPFV